MHNRVCEIRNLSKFGVWKLIPTNENPADIISKGCSPNFLVSNSLWFNGPEFLNLPEMHWPQLSPGNKFCEDPEEKIVNDNARINCIVNHVTVSRDQTINENKNVNIDIQDNNVSVNNSRLIRVVDLNKIIDIHRYNTLNTLITKKFGRKNFGRETIGREIFGRFFSKFRTISDKISDKISDSYIQKPAKFGQKMWK